MALKITTPSIISLCGIFQQVKLSCPVSPDRTVFQTGSLQKEFEPLLRLHTVHGIRVCRSNALGHTVDAQGFQRGVGANHSGPLLRQRPGAQPARARPVPS